ncbi:L-threonylcarbamoyladenylate synthase [Elongatibacter sediminis]|uniref:Threonylcarbamoyl-AMP synthase n=1 Tax=Elongatibacter sediminis TaxID=3119006 RepID=A0AAW9RIC3_9GAMM
MNALSLLDPGRAAACLHAGGVIAYPTEAVYGLGCDPGCEAAVRRILAVKQRRAEAGLILISDRYERFLPYVGELPDGGLERTRTTWPGPVTWLFPRHPSVPDWLAGSHDTIALRVTAHPECRALCAAFGGAVVSTSANPAGQEPARSAGAVADYFDDDIDGILEGELGGRAAPSEIRRLDTGAVVRGGSA